MDIWKKITDWYDSTHIHEQVKDVDVVGLFTNLWFVIPFGLMVGYMLFKQQWRDLIIVAIFIAVWWVSGTPYMDSLIVDGILQMDKILPVVFGGAAALGFVIYLLFGRSD
ncbi:MAG: hypothetical protein ACD_75C01649G0003 [uncultured bacterium]|nr:MAG: hypothetical protein ACD_75C01649G0003 [uncultured bacterium]